MNNLQVVLGNNSYLLLKESLKKLRATSKNLDINNIVIVPDKLSLITEQLIFDAIGQDVFFNISVMGISKFVKNLLKSSNLNSLECSNVESKLITLKAIQNTHENFKCFSKNYNLGFVDEIYAKIQQIKSSNESIENLIDPNASVGTKLKFQDLSLIFNEYEKIKGDKLDSGNLLAYFNLMDDNIFDLSKTNVYFLGFDSLTKQGQYTLAKIAKNAKETLIAITNPHVQNNSKIYDTTFFDSVINICKENKIECKVTTSKSTFNNKTKNFILNNLFSRKEKCATSNNYLNIISCNTLMEEIDFCQKSIVYLLKSYNLKYKNIAVCAPSNYHEILKNKLNSLQIDVYCDTKYSLINLEPILFLLNIFKYNGLKNTKYLLSAIFSDFLEINKQDKNKINLILDKYVTVKSAKKFEDNLELLQKIDILEENIQEEDTVQNYIEIIKNIYQKLNLNEKTLKKSENFADLDVNLSKVYLQIEDKLKEVLDNFYVIYNQTIKIDEFIKLLEKTLQITEISSVPSTTNQIFIGDEKSFYYEKDYIIILGNNEGVTPIIMSDYGLISDKEILSDTIKAKLEPTTKIINKRNKFKVFEILLSAKHKCILTYHNFDDENKKCERSEMIDELLFLFNERQTSYSQLSINKYYNAEKVKFNLLDNKNANLFVKENLGTRASTLVEQILKNSKKLYKKPLKTPKNIDFKPLFFKNDKISVSLVEKYCGCPKSAFLSYVLSLNKKQTSKVEANIIGNFIHEIAEKFVKNNNLGNLSDFEINSSINKIFAELILKSDYDIIKIDQNKYLQKLLLDESIRLAKFLNYEQSVSEFKPLYTEKYFGKNSAFSPLKISDGDKDYFVSGIVDRIDVCDDHFRIIDYKTGQTTNASGASNLFYGKKIQLFTYSMAIMQNLNKKLFGCYYLPIRNGFSSGRKSNYQLSGFFSNDPALICASDKNLSENGRSEILNVSLNKQKKEGQIEVKKQNNILSEQLLQKYVEYSLKMIKGVIKDVSCGFIEASPLGDHCKMCDYKDICRHFNNEKIKREEKFKIEPNTFLEISYE